MDIGRHKLSENIWFVRSKMSFSGDMERCHVCGRSCICVFVYFSVLRAKHRFCCSEKEDQVARIGGLGEGG